MKTFVLNDGIGYVELLDSRGDDKEIVNAARVSYNADEKGGEFNDKDYKLLKYLLQHEHGSPFEHNQLSFRVKAPLFIHAQWVKHRIGVSINTQSGRYVQMAEEFYIPAEFRGQSPTNKQGSVGGYFSSQENKSLKRQLSSAFSDAFATYSSLLSQGVAKEQARMVLPQSLYTEFRFTTNLRALLHFLHLRDDENAQWEIRQYATAMRQQAETVFPQTFRAIEEIGGIKHV